MPLFARIENPLRPELPETREVSGRSVREILAQVYGSDFKEFGRPTIIVIGKAPTPGVEIDATSEHSPWRPVMRAEWDAPIEADVVVVEMPVTTGILEGILITLVIAAIAAAVYVAATMKMPKVSANSTPEAGSVYGLNGESNKAKLGCPVETAYGRNRIWPSYGAAPYTFYKDNSQYLCQFFCIGHGTFDVEKVQIEDTPIANFPEAQHRIMQPGEIVWNSASADENDKLVWPRVYTLSEVSSIEMSAPNETTYPGGKVADEVNIPTSQGGGHGGLDDEAGWFGAFVTQPEGVKAFRIECDIVMNGGLFTTNKDDGSLQAARVFVEFQLRKEGESWQPLFDFDFVNDAADTGLTLNTARRFTLAKDVPSGTYEIRGRRVNRKSTEASDQSTITWESTKAWLPAPPFYKYTTLVVKARATNGLNQNSSNKINVIATRKLRTLYTQWINGVPTPTLSASETATRSPIDAFVDIAMSEYGGHYPLRYLDGNKLMALRDRLSTLGYNFDYIFDTRTTVWDALMLVGKACRCLPVINGSIISMIRDEKTNIPVAMFAPSNIVKGSFRYETKLASVDEYDGYLCEYMSSETWKTETVVCLAKSETGVNLEIGDNLETIQLPGITDKKVAYNEGLYLRQCARLLRHNVVFKTGLEGYLPLVGDMISVSFDVPKWGKSGLCMEMGSDYFVTDMELPVFAAGYERVVFRKKDGTAAGPYTVTGRTMLEGIELSRRWKLTFSGTFDPSWISSYEDAEPVLFMHGYGNDFHRLAKITGITPSEDDTVEITAHTYEPGVYNVTGPGGTGGGGGEGGFDDGGDYGNDPIPTQPPGGWPPGAGGGGSAEYDYQAILNALVNSDDPVDGGHWYTVMLGTDWPRGGTYRMECDQLAFLGVLFAAPYDTPNDYRLPNFWNNEDPQIASFRTLWDTQGSQGLTPKIMGSSPSEPGPISGPITNIPPAGSKVFLAVWHWDSQNPPAPDFTELPVSIHLHQSI